MPVQLDWEIEDADTPLPDATSETATRAPGCRRRLRLLALLLLIVLTALAFIGFKLRQKHNQIEDELRALVRLELTALIDGDQDLFLSRQAPDAWRWRRVQDQRFERYHDQIGTSPWVDAPPAVRYTGQVPRLHVTGDQAWAQVELENGTQTWGELWFYRWTQAEGWRHVPFDEEWLGQEQNLVTPHFRFTYPQRDEAAVRALAHEMEAWYDLLAPLLGLRPASETLLTLRFAYSDPTHLSPSPIHWDADDLTLLAPSPHQGHLAADGSPGPALSAQIAPYLAEALIAHQSGVHPEASLGPLLDALRDELRDWAVAQLAPASSGQGAWTLLPTPLLDALVARVGVQALPPLAADLGRAQTLDQALASAGLDPPDPATRLLFHLAALHRAFHDLDEFRYRDLLDPRSDSTWRQYQLDRFRRWRDGAQAGQAWPGPVSLQIKSGVFNDPITWVEVETTDQGGATYRQVHFFRKVGDRWLLTSPNPASFGQPLLTRTANLVFQYFEADAPWFEDRLPTELQALSSRAAADLGIPIDGLVITVEMTLQPGADGWPDDDGTRVRFTSPSVAGWRLDSLEDPVLQMAPPLLAALFQSALLNAPQDNYPYLFTHIAAFWWELERLFPDNIHVESWLHLDPGALSTFSLADLWEYTTPETSQESWEATWAGYRSLLDYLVATYGPQVVPALLDNVARTGDLDQWLRLSTGHGLDEIEPAWRAWLQNNHLE